MFVKYLTKNSLGTLNDKAIESGRKAVREEVVSSLKHRVRFPVTPALPFILEGWQRCVVTLGPNEDQIALLDIRPDAFETLRCVELPHRN